MPFDSIDEFTNTISKSLRDLSFSPNKYELQWRRDADLLFPWNIYLEMYPGYYNGVYKASSEVYLDLNNAHKKICVGQNLDWSELIQLLNQLIYNIPLHKLPDDIAGTTLSDWIEEDDDSGCFYRTLLNSDKRIAYIEKTPRVRVFSFNHFLELDGSILYPVTSFYTMEGCDQTTRRMNKLVFPEFWIYGPKGSDDLGRDEDSRAWVNLSLKTLGYTV